MKQINNYISEKLKLDKDTQIIPCKFDKSNGFEFTDSEIDDIKKFINNFPKEVKLMTNCFADNSDEGPTKNCIYFIFSDENGWIKNINKKDEFLNHDYIAIAKKDKKYFAVIWLSYFKDRLGDGFTHVNCSVNNNFKGYDDLEELFDKILNRANKLNFFKLMKNLKDIITEKLKLDKNLNIKCFPKTREELRNILEYRLKKDKNADLNDIDVSKITYMGLNDPGDGLFEDLDPHNIDISEWNVSNVTDMSGMFYGCKNFNCDLSRWDVSIVENMYSMFSFCENFNCDLNDWDVRNVEDMSEMFYECTSLKNKPKWYKE